MKTFYRVIAAGMVALILLLLPSIASTAPTTEVPAPSAKETTAVLSVQKQAADSASVANVAPAKATATTAASASEAPTDSTLKPTQWKTPAMWIIYTVLGVILFGSFIAMLFIRSALSHSDWLFGDALSEEVEINLVLRKPDGSEEVKLDASGNPVMVKVLRASVSRLIALMGMIVILLLFMGFGIFTLYSFAIYGQMPPSTGDILKFLTGGLTLFAPYVVNKFTSVFDRLPKSR